MDRTMKLSRAKVIPVLVFVTICMFLLAPFRQYLFPSPASQLVAETVLIVPGATWTATNTGRHIQAHGPGFIQVDDTYYWIGEDKSSGTFFQNINCYSSKNLVDWGYEGALLSKQDERGDLGERRIAERPKVIYNDKTKTYVMYLHIDDELYQEAKVGVATSTKGVCDPYTYQGSYRPLDGQSRDIGLFKDADGKGYLLTEDRPYGLHIELLSDTFTEVSKRVHTFPEHMESPAMVYLPHIGYYVIFGSHLTGWYANDNKYSYAPSLSGPWSEWKPFAPEGSKTFQTQVSYILPVGLSQSSGTGTVIYVGDRWDPENLMRSTYVWQPLEVDLTKMVAKDLAVEMENLRMWSLDLRTSSWADEEASSRVMSASKAKSLHGANQVPCRLCETGYGVQLKESAGIQFTDIPSPASGPAYFLVNYFLEGNDEHGAEIVFNDGRAVPVSFLPSGASTTDGVHEGAFISSIRGQLKKGKKNTVELRGVKGTNVTIDSLEVIIL